MIESLSKIVIVVFVVTTMFDVGLTLTLRDIAQSLLDRRYLARAMFANFVLLPTLALGVIRVISPEPAVAATLLLLATVPGAPGVIKLVALAREDGARAVSLVVMLMVVSMVYQPLVLPLLIDGVVVSTLDIARTLVVSVLLPLLAGMLLRARLATAAARLHSIAPHISTLSLVLILILVPMAHTAELGGVLETRSLAALTLFLVGAIAIGGALGGPTRSGKRVLAIACGQGNQAAAFLIATHNFDDLKIAVTLIVITLLSIGMLTPLALVFARGSRLAH